MSRQSRQAGVAELVDAMLELTAPVTQALDHMARAPGRPGAEEAAAVLHGLLCDVLEPLGMVMAPRDLRTATAVIEASVPLIAGDLCLLPHPAPRPPRDPRVAHRHGLRRRGRRTRE